MKLRAPRDRLNRLLRKAVKPCDSTWTACFGALAAAVVMFSLNIFFGQFMGSLSPLLFFLPAVAISSLLWGWLSGLKAVLWSLLFGYYFSPYEQLSVHSVVEDSIVFVAAALYATMLRGALLSAERNFEMYRDTEEKLAFSQRSAGVGSWDVDLKSGERFWTASFREVLHLSLDTPATFENFLATIHPDDVEIVRRRHEVALKTGRYRAEFRLHPSKGLRWILSVGRVLSDEQGEGKRFSGILMDITSLKVTGQALRESRGTFEALAEVAPLGILVTNAVGEIRYANRFIRELIRLGRSDARGRTWCDVLGADSSSSLARTWETCKRDSIPLNEEFIAPFLPRRERQWFQIQGVPIRFGESVRTRWLFVIADIHERRILSEKIRMLGDNLPNGAIYQSVDTPDGRSALLYISAGIEELTGYTPASLIASPHFFYERILEDDRELLSQAEQRGRETGKIFEVHFRIRTASGEVRWLLCRAAPEIHGRDGCVTWDGVLIDKPCASDF